MKQKRSTKLSQKKLKQPNQAASAANKRASPKKNVKDKQDIEKRLKMMKQSLERRATKQNDGVGLSLKQMLENDRKMRTQAYPNDQTE